MKMKECYICGVLTNHYIMYESQCEKDNGYVSEKYYCENCDNYYHYYDASEYRENL
jgi:hypothetical protein